MIPDAVLSQIQDRLDIVEVISAYLPLKRAGRNFKACCPFHHEKSPSFVVNPDKQIYHCFGCGAGGNVFGFVMKQERREFRDVVELLAERVGIELPKDGKPDKSRERETALAAENKRVMDFYHDFLMKQPAAAPAREYIKKRGLDAAMVERFKLGFAPDAWDTLYRSLKDKSSVALLEHLGLLMPKREGEYYDKFRNRVMFPIIDLKGNVVAFGGRVMDDSQPKYMNSPESELYIKSRHLYGLNEARIAIRDNDSVIVVEGYMDCLACFKAGVENVVASCGTALTLDQVRLLKRHTKNAIMLYDADAAGEAATQRGLELFLEEGMEVKILRLEKGYDPDSYIQKFGEDAFQDELKNATSFFDYKVNSLKEKFDAKSLEGRIKIANEMARLFTKLKNEIQKSAWIQELAKALSVSEAAIVKEIEKLKSPAAKVVSAPVTQAAAVAQNTPQAEKILVGLWMDDKRFIEKTVEILSVEDFTDPHVRTIAEAITGSEAGSPVSKLMNYFGNDEKVLRLLSEAGNSAESLSDKDKAFDDCVLWIRRTKINLRRQMLRDEMSAAERQGDRGRVSELLKHFNELNENLKKI